MRPEGFVVFDCDGVLLESNAAKSAGFAEVFSEWPQHAAEIVALHERHGGIGRYVKFEWIYRDILDLPLDDATSARLGAAYTDAVLAKVLAAPFVPGLEATLQLLSEADVPLYVLSGTPQAELELILRQRGLLERFVEVIGTPTTKPDALARLLAEADRNGGGPGLFVGDALCDLEAADAAGALFLGRVEPGETNPFPPRTRTVADLRDYDRAVGAMFAADEDQPRSTDLAGGQP